MNKYVYLAKPGIVFSNLFTAFTGIFMAINGELNFSLIFYAMLGILLVLASSTTLNNYIDRDIDSLMARTHNRVSVIGSVSPGTIVIFSLMLGVCGLCILFFFVNALTALIVVLGFLIYIVLYSLYFKRYSKHSTFVGSFSGAVLPLAGYTAITNQVDVLGITLFAILLTWQMPHFYAIGIFRLVDYKKASIPILPVATSIDNTKIHMFIWTVVFFATVLLPYITGYVGFLYLSVAILICSYWLFLSFKGFKTNENTFWARKVFFYSIFALVTLCVSMMVDKVLIVKGIL